MLKRIRNLSDRFLTITGGFVEQGGETKVQPWEAKMWLKDPTKKIEIIEEEIKKKRK